MTKDRKVYGYAYTPDAPGEEITQEESAGRVAEDYRRGYPPFSPDQPTFQQVREARQNARRPKQPLSAHPMPRVYLAGPIAGLTYEQGAEWRAAIIEHLRQWGIIGYSPMRFKAYLHTEGVLHSGTYETLHPLSSPSAIVGRDHNDTLRADAILANLLGATNRSLGTAMEIAWAHHAHIPVVMVHTPGDIHDHVMLTHCADFVCYDLETALECIRAIVLPW